MIRKMCYKSALELKHPTSEEDTLKQKVAIYLYVHGSGNGYSKYMNSLTRGRSLDDDMIKKFRQEYLHSLVLAVFSFTDVSANAFEDGQSLSEKLDSKFGEHGHEISLKSSTSRNFTITFKKRLSHRGAMAQFGLKWYEVEDKAPEDVELDLSDLSSGIRRMIRDHVRRSIPKQKVLDLSGFLQDKVDRREIGPTHIITLSNVFMGYTKTKQPVLETIYIKPYQSNDNKRGIFTMSVDKYLGEKLTDLQERAKFWKEDILAKLSNSFIQQMIAACVSTMQMAFFNEQLFITNNTDNFLVYRGTQTNRHMHLLARSFISTSKTARVAKEFAGTDCCVIVLHVKAGSRYINVQSIFPRAFESDYEDDSNNIDNELECIFPIGANVKFFEYKEGEEYIRRLHSKGFRIVHAELNTDQLFQLTTTEVISFSSNEDSQPAKKFKKG